jgi:UDP-N-acetylmuramoylalanine--D-glutamate ligase
MEWIKLNKKINSFKENVHGKKIAVIGLGISNLPLIDLLLKYNASITAFDKKDKNQLGEVYEDLKKLGIEIITGENYLDCLEHDIIFKTPGMRPDVPELKIAKKKGSIVTSEMEVFFDLCPAEIIGVTGSDGKTTTTTLIYEFLKKEGYTCWLGGNIGKPLLSEIENIKPEHKVVLELSSFQLHTMQKSPNISVITNITPNHLDMHKSMDEYIDAKKNIFLHQKPNDKLIINFDNPITQKIASEAHSDVMFFSRKKNINNGIYLSDNDIVVSNKSCNKKTITTFDIRLQGVHNLENYLAAILAVIDKVGIDSIKEVANTFYGVPHRLEFVREINGIKFYNDSIGSSPARTIAGLNSFNESIVLIAGGYDKEISFKELGDIINEKTKCLVLIGVTADKIEDAVISSPLYSQKNITIVKCNTLEDAVKTAYTNSTKDDIILLSPACASFDMFKNFEDRGNRFKEIVNSYIAVGGKQ